MGASRVEPKTVSGKSPKSTIWVILTRNWVPEFPFKPNISQVFALNIQYFALSEASKLIS